MVFYNNKSTQFKKKTLNTRCNETKYTHMIFIFDWCIYPLIAVKMQMIDFFNRPIILICFVKYIEFCKVFNFSLLLSIGLSSTFENN